MDKCGEITFEVDMSKVKVNDDGSVTVGSDELTKLDVQLGHKKPVAINGDILLALLTGDSSKVVNLNEINQKNTHK